MALPKRKHPRLRAPGASIVILSASIVILRASIVILSAAKDLPKSLVFFLFLGRFFVASLLRMTGKEVLLRMTKDGENAVYL